MNIIICICHQVVDSIVQTFLTYCHLVVDSDWHVIWVVIKSGMERNGMEPIGARVDFKTS